MISLRHSFLFVHRGKTGGNSVSAALLPYADDRKIVEGTQDGINRFDVRNETFGTLKHTMLRQYAARIPPEIFAGLFKFSTLRNPFPRLVSAYFSPHRVADLGITGFVRADFAKLVQQQHTMREFVCLGATGPLDGDLDMLMRFENLEADFQAALRRIGIGPIDLPHRNRGAPQDYRGYYDAELRALVEQRFREELDWGGYDF
jgi:hypothetical protein